MSKNVAFILLTRSTCVDSNSNTALLYVLSISECIRCILRPVMSYDEDISTNPVFRRIVTRFPQITREAPLKSLLLCIPKSAIAKEIVANLQDGDLLNYVLKPTNSSPQTGVEVYSTLTKKLVEVRGSTLLLRHGFSEERTVRVLFEETFYNTEDKSFPVLCVDQPFEGISILDFA